VGIEAGNAINFIEGDAEALSEVLEGISRQESVFVLDGLEFCNEHGLFLMDSNVYRFVGISGHHRLVILR